MSVRAKLCEIVRFPICAELSVYLNRKRCTPPWGLLNQCVRGGARSFYKYVHAVANYGSIVFVWKRNVRKMMYVCVVGVCVCAATYAAACVCGKDSAKVIVRRSLAFVLWGMAVLPHPNPLL